MEDTRYRQNMLSICKKIIIHFSFKPLYYTYMYICSNCECVFFSIQTISRISKPFQQCESWARDVSLDVTDEPGRYIPFRSLCERCLYVCMYRNIYLFYFVIKNITRKKLICFTGIAHWIVFYC